MTTYVVAANHKVFVNWCQDRCINPRSASVVEVNCDNLHRLEGRRFEDGDEVHYVSDGHGIRGLSSIWQKLAIMGVPVELLR